MPAWLNRVEIELSHVARQRLNRRLEDMNTVKNEVAAWVIKRNKNCKVVHWQFNTAEDARIKLKKLYPILQNIRQI